MGEVERGGGGEEEFSLLTGERGGVGVGGMSSRSM